MTDMARQAVVLGDVAWWRDYYGVTSCARCGRSGGLTLGIETAVWRVIKCDCNYAHIVPAQRAMESPKLVLP